MENLPRALQYYYDDDKQRELETLIRNYHSASSSEANLENLIIQMRALSLSQNVPRLCQAIIKIQQSRVSLDLFAFKILFDTAFTDDDEQYHDDNDTQQQFMVSGKNIFRKLLQMVDPFVNPRKHSTESEWTIHRNVCLVLAIVIEKYYAELELKQFEPVFEYLLMIIKNEFDCNVPEAKLYALICVERLLLINKENEKFIDGVTENSGYDNSTIISLMRSNEFNSKLFNFSDKTLNKLKFVLRKLATYLNECEIYSVDSLQYQISFYSDWILSHIFENSAEKDFANQVALQSVKISPNRLSVRNSGLNRNYLTTIRSAFDFQTGVFYFETILLTDGAMRIGWATSLNEFKEDAKIGVGQAIGSIGYDGKEKCVYYDDMKIEFPEGKLLPRWLKGDVVGCLIDLTNKKFIFYLNQYQLKIEMNSSTTQTYFAACSLYPHQQAFFNFGQMPFKYLHMLELNNEIQNFHLVCDGNLEKFQLLEPILTQNLYWFKTTLSNNLELFQDELQKQFDQWVIDIETKHLDGNFRIDNHPELANKIKSLIQNDHSVIRLLQAAINYLGTVVNVDNIIQVVVNISKSVASLNYKLPRVGKFLEIINSYLSRQISQESDDIRKQRNIVIILHLLMIDYDDLNANDIEYSETKVNLYDVVINFLEKTLQQTKDHLTILFGILCLEHLAIQSEIRPKMQEKQETFKLILEKFFPSDNFKENPKYSESYHWNQIHFCASWSLQNIFNNEATIKNKDILKRIKISQSKNSLRSDYGNQTTIFLPKLNEGVYFYEIVPITYGELQFGWTFYYENASDKTEYEKTILFDLYNHCILNNDAKFTFESLGIGGKPCWKRGNAMGCLIDCPNEKFVFYLNGDKVLEYTSQEFDFKQPFCPTFKLGLYNQCYVNTYDDEPYKYPPKVIEFKSIYIRKV